MFGIWEVDMRSVVIALALLVAVPAYAADCTYSAPDGRTAVFVKESDDPLVVITSAAGVEDQCYWMRSDEGTGMRLSCDSGLDEFFEMTDTRSGRAMILAGETWKATCS